MFFRNTDGAFCLFVFFSVQVINLDSNLFFCGGCVSTKPFLGI